MVVSDYEAVTEMIRHGYARDSRDAARKAAAAGVDMEMVSTAYFDHLKSLVESGEVSIGQDRRRRAQHPAPEISAGTVRAARYRAPARKSVRRRHRWRWPSGRRPKARCC